MNDGSIVPFEMDVEFDAPRDLVWKAWTEADRLPHWWGPAGMALTVGTLELLPGGLFHYGMTLPNGQTWWGRFVYQEIDAPERLVFVTSFSDEHAGIARHPLAPAWPLETLSRMTLTELPGGRTRLTSSAVPVRATPEEIAIFTASHESMRGGFSGTFAQLHRYLEEAQRTMQFDAIIHADPARVFTAWTDPAQVGDWWGPEGFTITTQSIDIRPGGSWAFTMRGPDGRTHADRISYGDIEPNQRLTYAHGKGFTGDPDRSFEVAVDFAPHADGTALRMRVRFPDRASHDEAIAAGALDTASGSMRKLDAWLASTR